MYLYHMHFKVVSVNGQSYDHTTTMSLDKPLCLKRAIQEAEQAQIDQYGLRECTLLHWTLLSAPTVAPLEAKALDDTITPALARIDKRLKRLANLRRYDEGEAILARLQDLARHLGAPVVEVPPVDGLRLPPPRVPQLHQVLPFGLPTVRNAVDLADLHRTTFNALMVLDDVAATSAEFNPLPGAVGELAKVAGIRLRELSQAAAGVA